MLPRASGTGKSPHPVKKLRLSGLEDARRDRSALLHVRGQPARGEILPAPALDEGMAERHDVFQPFAGLDVGRKIAGEDQVVGGVTNPLLLGLEQLARSQVLEGLHHPAVCVGTFRTHLRSPVERSALLGTWSAFEPRPLALRPNFS